MKFLKTCCIFRDIASYLYAKNDIRISVNDLLSSLITLRILIRTNWAVYAYVSGMLQQGSPTAVQARNYASQCPTQSLSAFLEVVLCGCVAVVLRRWSSLTWLQSSLPRDNNDGKNTFSVISLRFIVVEI